MNSIGLKSSSAGRASRAVAAAFAAALALGACGGGGSNSGSPAPAPAPVPSPPPPPPAPPPPPPPPPPPTRMEAARFLTQATFGPTEADIDAVVAKGYEAWLDEQLAKSPSLSYQTYWDQRNTLLGGTTQPPFKAGQSEVVYAFWKQALNGPDQVRARVAFAWSQVFVVSMVDSNVAFNVRGVAGYMDMLNAKGLGKYRDLLESVSLHPMMGLYLTSIRNRKENAATGRVPDENYSREVMQLFSIGLYELNTDGTLKLTAGAPKDTYTPSDISNLAKVFTGWSWACPSADDRCFTSGVDNDNNSDLDRLVKPMRAYPQFHAPTEKKFLGVTVPDQGTNADPVTSMKVALDTLAAHPNVGPFLARQMIQRLVTSNPSPGYIGRVATAFNQSGGDLKALVKAVLLDTEARSATLAQADSFGKLREPLLRATAFLRAFESASDSGDFLIGLTDDPASSLGQTALRAPSVFNFYRPGFMPAGGNLAQGQLLSPEMQITHETSLAGYANVMRTVVDAGSGAAGYDGKSTLGRDVKPEYLRNATSKWVTLADTPDALVDQVNQRLLYGRMPADLKTEIVGAITKIAIPAATGTNQTAIDTARKNRLKSAIYLTLLSPEFLIQK